MRRAGSFSVFSGKENVSSTTSTSDVSRRVVLSCSPTRGRLASGFVAVALAPDGADAPAAAEPVASLLVPSPKEGPRFFGVLGGAHVPAAAGAHVWLAGAHLLPRGGGGSWPGTNAGFGWGNGGDVTCAVDAFDVASREKTTFNEKTPTEKKNVFGAARFVSSALVACEVPDVFVARATTLSSQSLRSTQETDVRLRASVAEIGFASFENENENENENAERVVARARRAARLCRRRRATRFSPPTAARRCASRGAVSGASGTHRVTRAGSRVRSVRWRPWPCAREAGENALAGENAGVCASPARAPEKAAGRNRNKPFAVSSRNGGGFSFGVAYPNFGRARFEPEASDNAAEVVSMASARLWTPLASAVPRSGARRFASPGFASPRAPPRRLGTRRARLGRRAISSRREPRPTRVFVSFACASPRVARGGFCDAPGRSRGLRRDRRRARSLEGTPPTRHWPRVRVARVRGAPRRRRRAALGGGSRRDGGVRRRVGFPGRREPGDPGAAAGACFCAFFAEKKRERRNALRGGGGARLLDAHAVRDAPSLRASHRTPLGTRSGRRRDGSEEASKRVFVRRRVAASRRARRRHRTRRGFRARARPALGRGDHRARRPARRRGAPVVGAGGRRRRARRRLRRGRRRRSVVFRKRFGFRRRRRASSAPSPCAPTRRRTTTTSRRSSARHRRARAARRPSRSCASGTSRSTASVEVTFV